MLMVCALLIPAAGTAEGDGLVIEDGTLLRYEGEGGDVAIPDGVTAIDEFAFSYCTSLTGLRIPGSVTQIGESAFEGCAGLKNVQFPDGLTTIGDAAFMFCTHLEQVSIPDTVISIGDRAFSRCSMVFGRAAPAWSRRMRRPGRASRRFGSSPRPR
jgi:hypothetical protein